MPPITPQKELDFLVELISAEPEGLGIEALLRQLGNSWQRHTLQRRLALLVEQKRLQMHGEGRAVRYRRTAAPGRSASVAARSATGWNSWRRITRTTQPICRKTCASNCMRWADHLQSRPPAGTFARDILNRLLIDLSWASSHLEGNTYSRLDTERLIEYGQAAEGKDALETQMILNHKQAIEYLVLNPEHARVDTGTLIALHAFLSDGLMADPAAVGRIRRRAVEIRGSVYLPQRLEELFGIVVQMAAEIADPFEQAFFLMVHLPYLQPFEDVNKRVSRLAANIPFIRHNLCPLSFIDVPQQAYVNAMIGVYELNRIELLRDLFVWAYERSCQQYVAVRQTLVPPDLFRLRHRQALAEVIADIVRQDEAATEHAIRGKIPATVPQAEQDHFIRLVLAEFDALHAGNAVRFGIRPLELAAWQSYHCLGV